MYSHYYCTAPVQSCSLGYAFLESKFQVHAASLEPSPSLGRWRPACPTVAAVVMPPSTCLALVWPWSVDSAPDVRTLNPDESAPNTNPARYAVQRGCRPSMLHRGRSRTIAWRKRMAKHAYVNLSPQTGVGSASCFASFSSMDLWTRSFVEITAHLRRRM